MYKLELSQDSLTKFHEVIREYREKVLRAIKEQQELIKTLVDLDDIIANRNISGILSNRELLIKINPELENSLRIIEFFYNSNLTNVEQVISNVTTITEDAKVKKYLRGLNRAKNTTRQLTSSIHEYDAILNNESLNNEFMVKVLEKSTLSEDEKLEILSYYAFKSCKKDTIELKEESEDLTEYQSMVFKSYNDIMNQTNQILNKYYHLITKSTPEQIATIEMTRQLISDIEGTEFAFDVSTFKNSKIIMMLYLLELMKDKKECEEQYRLAREERSKDNLEMLGLASEVLEESLGKIVDIAHDYEFVEEEINSVEPRNYYLFTTDGINPLFTVDSLEMIEKDAIIKLLRQSENNIDSYRRGEKHSVLLTETKTKHKIFLNRKHPMASAYIKVDNDTNIIITIDSISSIFGYLENVVLRYSDEIDAFIEQVKNATPEFINDQNAMINTLKNQLTEKKGERLK